MLASATRYYAEQQRLSALAVRQLRQTSDLTEILRLLAVYQATAALLAMEHGSEALRERDLSDDGARLIPTAFTVTPGAPSVVEDVDSRPHLDRLIGSLVSDAGRSAMGAYTASRDREYGHIRVLKAPSCARCAILAGRFYRWSDGFQRHPRCDCAMVPATRAESLADPFGAFERGEIGSYRTLPDGTKRFESGLSRAQTKAIEDGADISQVVNARKGMQTVNFAGRPVQITTEGTTSRGLAFRALSQRGTTTQRFVTGVRPVTRTVARAPRLTPEAIYRVASDRADAIRLLRANGYIR